MNIIQSNSLKNTNPGSEKKIYPEKKTFANVLTVSTVITQPESNECGSIFCVLAIKLAECKFVQQPDRTVSNFAKL